MIGPSRARLLVLTALLAGVGPLAAQPPEPAGEGAELLGEGVRAAKRIDEARQKIEAGEFREAIDALQRIIEEAGGELVPADGEGRHFVPARRECHRLLARLPAPALRLYRVRVEAAARRLFEEGRDAREPRRLREVVERYFCAPAAEEALLLLGELAFEQGEFGAARHYWGLLARPAGAAEPEEELVFPGPKTDSAELRARLIVCLALDGQADAARHELGAFRALHPDASGHLAGREGKYVATLEAVLAEAARDPAPAGAPGSWPTLGGSPERNGVVSEPLPYYWPDSPTWRRPIPGRPPAEPDGPPAEDVPPSEPRALAFHPVIDGDRVYLCDAERVYGLDLLTGQSREVFRLRGQGRAVGEDPPAGAAPPGRFSLTAYGGWLYARLGEQPVRPPEGMAEGGGEGKSYLVGLGPRTGAGGDPSRAELEAYWLIPARSADGDPPAVWEGAPVAAGDRIFCAQSRFDGGKVVSRVVCFEGVTDPRYSPEPAWARDVASAAFDPNSEPRHLHHLLTRAANQVVYCTHDGLLAALDAATGEVNWAYRYPRAGPAGTGTPATSGPCLYAGGRVFAAPADADGLFCLDAFTGRLLWEQPLRAEHLLGVARGRLICTTGGQVRGIWGGNVEDGSLRPPQGWGQHDEGGLRSYGRGLVAENAVLWPTTHGLHFLRPDTGEPLRLPLRRGVGNLAYAGGCLIVTTPTEVLGFVSEGRLLSRRRRDAARHRPEAPPAGADPELCYRLALAEADAGDFEAALASFRRCETLALGKPVPDERLAALAERRAFELVADRAERAAGRGETDAARKLLRSLTRDHLPAARRTWALARLALLEEQVGRAGEAAALWDRLAESPEFGGEMIPDERGLSWPAGALAARARGRLTPGGGHAGEVRPATAGEPDAATPLPRPPEAPLRRVWSAPLDPLGEWPLMPFPGAGGSGPVRTEQGECFLTARGREVRCRSVRTGGLLWERTLRFAPLFAGAEPCAILAAGEGGVARLRPGDGEIVWQWQSSALDPLAAEPGAVPLRSLADPPGPAPLSAFRAAGGKVFFLEAGRRLVALNADSGLPAWGLDAAGPGDVVTADSPAFNPHFHAGPDRLLVQRDSGEVWDIDPSSGEVRRRLRPPAPTGILRRWAQPPTPAGGGRFLLATNPEQVVLLDPAAGEPVIWSHLIDRPAGLSGTMPELRLEGRAALVLVRRNRGDELLRLDVDTGRLAWAVGPQVLGRSPASLDAAGVDAATLYLPAGGRLVALRLEDGVRLWEAPIPGARGGEHWQVRAGGRALLLHPERAVRRDPAGGARPAPPLRLAALPRLGPALYDEWVRREYPLLLVDPADGQLVQRLNFPAAGPHARTLTGAGRAVVALGGGVWGLEGAPAALTGRRD